MFNKKAIGEELLKLFEKVKDKTVIVEGKRDKEVLCLFGFKKIITLNKGLYETVENINAKEVLILTDFDKEGKEIAKKLNIFLQSLGHRIDQENRRKIGLMLSNLKIKKIEELKGDNYG